MTKHDPEDNTLIVNAEKRGTKATIGLLRGTADIIEQRSGTHGDAYENLADIAKRWSKYLNALQEKRPGYRNHAELTVADVSYLMVEMKLSRATYGDSMEQDHLQDIVGYGAIGCSFLKNEAAKKKNRAPRKAKSEEPYHGLMKPKDKDLAVTGDAGKGDKSLASSTVRS